MFSKKNVLLLLLVGLFGTTLYAKQQDPDMISYKDYKEKTTTHVIQKKVNKLDNNDKLSKSTKVKSEIGQIASDSFLSKGSLINTNKYENVKNTDLYRINNKVFRISRQTKEILAVLN
jgi:hypothetical protein